MSLSLQYDLVAKHINKWRRLRFEWGKSDCTILVADYLRNLTGVDYASKFRGGYGEDWQVVTGCENLVDLFESSLDCGFVSVKVPIRGDVGVIRLGSLQMGALCLGSAWAIKSKSGLLVSSTVKHERAWRYVRF